MLSIASSANIDYSCTVARVPSTSHTMALPRRTPWRSFEDFEQVFGLLFASGGDPVAQRQGISRVSCYVPFGPCLQQAKLQVSRCSSDKLM